VSLPTHQAGEDPVDHHPNLLTPPVQYPPQTQRDGGEGAEGDEVRGKGVGEVGEGGRRDVRKRGGWGRLGGEEGRERGLGKSGGER
jgi:hypothetical protein